MEKIIKLLESPYNEDFLVGSELLSVYKLPKEELESILKVLKKDWGHVYYVDEQGRTIVRVAISTSHTSGTSYHTNMFHS